MPDITVDQSPIIAALDAYYTFLTSLTQGMNGNIEKLAIGNLITPFDIASDTPFYNEGLFAQYVDRVIIKSPNTIGPADQADRFSMHYENVIRFLANSIDQRHPEIVPKINELTKAINKVETEINDEKAQAEDGWNKFAKIIGTTPVDPQHELKYVKYMEDIRFNDQIAKLSEKIDALNSRIDQVRNSTYKAHELPIIQSLYQLSNTRKLARPKRPQFERDKLLVVTELTFADPRTRLEAVMNIYPTVLPLGDLGKFLSDIGAKTFTVKNTDTRTSVHEKSWNGSGSVGFSFFSIGGGGGGSSSATKSVSKTTEITISVQNASEYLVDRGYWFNPGILESENLFKEMTKVPGFNRLKYVIASLIIVRGISITLKSDESFLATDWTKSEVKARGGTSFLGINFGGGGGGSKYDFETVVSADGKELTISDASSVCRVMGCRVSPINQKAKDSLEPLVGVSNTAFHQYMSGKASYVDLMGSRFLG